MPEQPTGRTATALLYLHAQTSLHAGCGTAVGAVDMPVQRERHTQWPVIPGSALKGVFRDVCRRRTENGDEDEEVLSVFGPAVGKDASENAGALTFTDARLLAFPVRSLSGVFAWTTCPAVLERLARDLELADSSVSEFSSIPQPKEGQVSVPAGSRLVVNGSVVLEEFDAQAIGGADAIAKWLASQLPQTGAYKLTTERLNANLAILPDDDFTHFARHATEVVARIALNHETKTVSGSALFYQELVPPESIFYSVVLGSESRRGPKDRRKSAREVVDFLETRLPPTVQIGGNETTGKGLCRTSLKRKGS